MKEKKNEKHIPINGKYEIRWLLYIYANDLTSSMENLESQIGLRKQVPRIHNLIRYI